MYGKQKAKRSPVKNVKAQAKFKVQEQEAKTDTAEVAGVYAHAQSLTSRANTWAVTLSSTVRPISAYLIITLWLTVKLLAVLQIYFDGGEIYKVIDVIFTDYDAGLMSSVICFYLGLGVWRNLENEQYYRSN